MGFKVAPLLRCRDYSTCTVINSVISAVIGNGVDSTGGHFEGNVMWKNHAGFHIRGSTKLLHNALFSCLGGTGPTPVGEPSVSPSGISVQDGGGGMTLIGNTVAGSEGPGISFFDFDVPVDRFRNNTAHANAVGFTINGDLSEPVQDMTIWR